MAEQSVQSDQAQAAGKAGSAMGVIVMVLGVLIYMQWPMSGTWAVGTLAGISMMFSGSTLMAMGRALRGAAGDDPG